MQSERLQRKAADVLYKVVFRRLPPSASRFGPLSKRLRSWAGRHILAQCGHSVNIERGASFGANVRLGDRSGIGLNCHLRGPITIGDDVMMAPEVMILTTAHVSDDLDRPMREQGNRLNEPVIVGDDVWIGARAIILPGVNVGAHSIIGAGSVVTRDIPEWSVAVGNPAAVVRSRR